MGKAAKKDDTRALLWVVPKWPLPAHDGARMATVNLVRRLTAADQSQSAFTIDLLAFAGKGENIDESKARRELGVRDVYVIRRPESPSNRIINMLSLLKSLLLRPFLPVTMRFFTSGQTVKEANALLTARGICRGDEVVSRNRSGKSGWSAVVYDGLHGALPWIRKGCFKVPQEIPTVIYRAHNREADIWAGKAERSGFFPLKIFFKYQSRRVAEIENSLVRASRLVMPVSETDLSNFQRAIGPVKGAVLPIGYEFGKNIRQQPGNFILFIGRLDWRPNREGLEWFLKEVWAEVLNTRRDLNLVIAGSGDGSFLKRYTGMQNMEFLGEVEDIRRLYQKAVLSLVPVFYGSGTRVKVIEASRFGCACLSTKLGVEGLNLKEGKSYIRAESREEWIESLTGLELQTAKTIGQRAYMALKENYEAGQSALRFKELLREAGIV